MTEQLSIAYICIFHIFFVHSFINEHLGCFHTLLASCLCDCEIFGKVPDQLLYGQ